MINIRDDKGYNQGFRQTPAMVVRTEKRAEYMLGLMDRKENGSVLEIGCGRGEIAHHIASRTKNQVLGTDICIPFIEEARSKYTLSNLQFEVLDFNNPADIRNRKFDYIVGNGILHHLYNNLDEAFQSFRDLLNPNGKIIFLEPNLLNPYCWLIFDTTPFFRKLAKLEPTEMAFTKTFIQNKLQKAGFSEILVEYKDFLLPVVPSFLIKPSIVLGRVLEQTPLLKTMSQSLFISAAKNV